MWPTGLPTRAVVAPRARLEGQLLAVLVRCSMARKVLEAHAGNGHAVMYMQLRGREVSHPDYGLC